MGLILRQESAIIADNLETFEREKKLATEQGAASLEKFEQKGLEDAVKNLGDGDGSTSTSSETNDPEPSDTDGGGDEDSFDDFDDNPDDSDDSEEDSDTESEDEPPEEEPEEESEDEDDGEDSELKKESFRNLEPIPNDLMFRMENNFVSGLADHALSAWSGFTFVVGVLASVGIKYGPSVLSGMFKVVLYTFARTFQLLGSIYDVCSQRIERTVNSTSRQAKRVQVLLDSLQKVVDEGGQLSSEDANESFIVPLVGGSTSSDIAHVLRSQAAFTTNSFGKLLRGMALEFEGLDQIATNRHLGRHFDAMKYMNNPPSATIFSPSHESSSSAPRGTRLYTLGTLPAGGVRTLVSLPLAADNWSEIESNYNNTSFELVGAYPPREVLAKTPEELLKIIQASLVLIEANKKHEVFYERLANARSGVLTSIRALFIKLVQSKTRVSFKDSVALPLFLKTSIATKVYLVAAMDIQDHNSRVVASVLSFAEKNMKLFRKPKDQE